MKDFFEEIVERIKDFKFSDTFEDADDEMEDAEDSYSTADDYPVLDEFIINR